MELPNWSELEDYVLLNEFYELLNNDGNGVQVTISEYDWEDNDGITHYDYDGFWVTPVKFNMTQVSFHFSEFEDAYKKIEEILSETL